tara:strand:- start:274 stop:501 length:228 start_codon:yes stop_codon:yes gene_type:complete
MSKIYGKIKNKLKWLWNLAWVSEYCPLWAIVGGNIIILTMLLALGIAINHLTGLFGLITIGLLIFLWIISKDLEK